MDKIKEEFFDKCADKLEELYPKGISKQRSMALVFNAHIQMIFDDILSNLKQYDKIK